MSEKKLTRINNLIEESLRRGDVIERKKQIIIATEGTKTEPAYFMHLNKLHGSDLVIPIKRDTHPSPPQVLQDLKLYLNKMDLHKNAEYWVVSDVDRWTAHQKQIVEDWCDECIVSNFLAVSNPCFELWLILHFTENLPVFTTSKSCKRYYVTNIGGNNTVEDFKFIKFIHVKYAIENAKKRDNSDNNRWPETSGVTTVYKLVQRYFED